MLFARLRLLNNLLCNPKAVRLEKQLEQRRGEAGLDWWSVTVGTNLDWRVAVVLHPDHIEAPNPTLELEKAGAVSVNLVCFKGAITLRCHSEGRAGEEAAERKGEGPLLLEHR